MAMAKASASSSLPVLANALRTIPPVMAEAKSQTKKVENLVQLCSKSETPSGKIDLLDKFITNLKKKLKELRELKDKLESGFSLTGSQRDARVGKLFRDYNKRLKPDVEKTLSAGIEVARKSYESLRKFRAREKQNSNGNAQDDTNSNHAKLMANKNKPQGNIMQNSPNLHGNNHTYGQDKHLHFTLQQTPATISDEIILEEEAALRDVEKQSVVLKELAMDVSSLLEHQGGDVDNVEENTDVATEKMVDGVMELAIAKKREARKHTTRGSLISGVTGGVTGLVVAGPVGMIIGGIAGAGLGGAVGGGVTAASRWSIDAEIRSLKALRAVKVEKNGDFMCKVEVFENEKWGSLKAGGRGWKSSIKSFPVPEPAPAPASASASASASITEKSKHMKLRDWTDEVGNVLVKDYPHPDMTIVNSATSPKDVLPLILGDEALKICKEEIDSMDWKWAKGTWYVDASGSKSDLHGWSYAYSRTSTSWYPEMSRSTYVRRRKWVHHIFGTKRLRASKTDWVSCSRSLNAMASSSGRSQNIYQSQSSKNSCQQVQSARGKQHLYNAISTMYESNAITAANAEAVEIQGDQIKRSLKNSFMVGDTTEHADRISRAADFTGVIKNLVTGYVTLQKLAFMYVLKRVMYNKLWYVCG
mmetsp:Transcript_35610/g.44088  ORF Transcript_35610/g.44088 Transcript_35610/m.44088 type:complete len:646 (-) Transcript_35610:1472-3409(-)